MAPLTDMEKTDMSTSESGFDRSISPVGDQTDVSLSQILGLSQDDATLSQLHEELAEIRDNEREAEKAVANIRLN
ncbi:MAG TPA: hypothetical protein VHD58_10895 [Mycobacteriales bacterium]|nr:hypothetical protein [Mycobacteriales bacterium]